MDNILENNNISFHGINFDYFKMLSILRLGILSYSAAQYKGVSLKRNFKGYNGSFNVSLSESPSIHGTYNFGAFNSYIKNGISFVIDTSNLYCIPDRGESKIPWEIYAIDHVPRENIIGIMLPEQFLQTSINQLNIFGDIGTGFIDDYALKLIDEINLTFETSFSKEKIIDLIKSKKSLSGDFFDKMNKEKNINKQINETITKLFDLGFKAKYNLSESPTLIDAINILTDGNIPIYSTTGELLSDEKRKNL